MTEKINNMGEPENQQERIGSPAVLLEQPFIRCSSCWAIYFSILFGHVAEIWPGRPAGKGNGLPFSFLQGPGFISFSGRLREDPATQNWMNKTIAAVLTHCSIYTLQGAEKKTA